MPDYRLYFLDDRGVIRGREDFRAEDDDEAVECAGLVLDACSDVCAGFELWSGVRKVADRNLATNRVAGLERLTSERQARVLALEETLQHSHWQIANSKRLGQLAETALHLGVRRRNLRRFDHIVAYTVKRTGAEMLALQVIDGNALKLVGSYGFDQDFLNFFDVVTEDEACACGTAFASKRQVLVSDVATSPLFGGRSRQVIEAAGIRSVVSTPIISRNDELLGMLAIHRRAPWYPSSAEILDINTICNELSLQLGM